MTPLEELREKLLSKDVGKLSVVIDEAQVYINANELLSVIDCLIEIQRIKRSYRRDE